MVLSTKPHYHSQNSSFDATSALLVNRIRCRHGLAREERIHEGLVPLCIRLAKLSGLEHNQARSGPITWPLASPDLRRPPFVAMAST